MSFPSFVIEQLLDRFAKSNPSVGKYFSHTFNRDHALVMTTSGKIEIPEHILQRQLEDPLSLDEKAISLLASGVY